jgi:hypothetical protein
MPGFYYVTDHLVRSVLETERPAHRAADDIARALQRTLHHVHRDSLDETICSRLVERRAAHYIRAEAAWQRGDKPATIAALRAVWSDRPLAKPRPVPGL